MGMDDIGHPCQPVTEPEGSLGQEGEPPWIVRKIGLGLVAIDAVA